MSHSFVAYIDESGDDGIGKFRQPGAEGGASVWLIISACIVRASRDLEAVAWRDEIVTKMGGQKRRVHFHEMTHGQRTMACQVLAQKPIRLAHIVSNKQTIPEGVYREKNQLYCYLTRYLIERISWMCRDFRPQVPEGDGRVKIVFSRRGKMSYEDFRAYLMRLKTQEETTVHWPVIDVDGIEAVDHSRRAGLQLADIGCSAFAAGLEMDKYGNCESRYGESLKSVVYNRRGNFLSYGLKLVPSLDKMQLSPEQTRLIASYQKK